MKLVIDIGNTNTKLALFDNKTAIKFSNIYQCKLREVQEFVEKVVITSSIISSVKELNSEILRVASYFNAIIFSYETPVPIINNYKTPETLGKDRLAAVVGAAFLYPENDILVFDAGTCLTIDFINIRNEYIGGRISPGIEMRFKALNTFTDKLPLVQQEKISNIIGEDTNSSIISGVQRGVLAEVELIISEYKLQNPDIISVVTGGDCFFFEKALKNSIFANPNLVLVGLNEILDYNE
ncbi:MAG: pantothenate kinase [Flavobacteriales bacterium]|nr:pantothenate kinase [Flavobacteriales bacterium]